MKKQFVIRDSNRLDIMQNIVKFLCSLPDGKPWSVVVDRYCEERTSKQNNALFGVAYVYLMNQTGFTKDELHDIYCKSFFGTVKVVYRGIERERPFRTTTHDENGNRDVLKTDVFAQFYAHVQQQAAEMDLYVPDPDPEFRINKNQERWAA